MFAPALLRSPTYLRKLLRRSLVLWLLVRFTLIAFGLLAVATGALPVSLSAALSWIVILLLALIVAVLAQVDARVVREPVFHANLGTPHNSAGVVAAVSVVVIESVIAIVAGMM